MYFHYAIYNKVIYLTLCPKSYPRALAFKFLEDVRDSFETEHGGEVATANKPYQFVQFYDTIDDIANNYPVSNREQTQGQLEALSEELQSVQRVMVSNLSDILGRGEVIGEVSNMSQHLVESSAKFADQARALDLHALWREWKTVVIIVAAFLLFVMLRYFVF
ncbi:hypothetical protein KIPB_005086 [Kipferlia bialata]|uniref:Uncharacterized protein n=1 Tax=Kipferlia bialata TaxID=797122 RepID=A0A9K3GIS8_9EUKA|nr:hypothetical protein KIPB_005086 [Kipferlia bialata]|eukprot:g5086.t1